MQNQAPRDKAEFDREIEDVTPVSLSLSLSLSDM